MRRRYIPAPPTVKYTLPVPYTALRAIRLPSGSKRRTFTSRTLSTRITEPMTDTLYRGCPPAYTAVGGSLEEDSAEEELEPDAAEELDGDPQTGFLP